MNCLSIVKTYQLEQKEFRHELKPFSVSLAVLSDLIYITCFKLIRDIYYLHISGDITVIFFWAKSDSNRVIYKNKKYIFPSYSKDVTLGIGPVHSTLNIDDNSSQVFWWLCSFSLTLLWVISRLTYYNIPNYMLISFNKAQFNSIHS